MIKRVIVGISGTELTDVERKNLNIYQPLGVVLFARNIDNYEQVKKLTSDIRKVLNHDYVHISVDQEGGSVSRLENLFGVETLSAQDFRLAYKASDDKSIKKLNDILYKQNSIIAQIMLDLGINMNFAPVGDIYHDDYTAQFLVKRIFADNVNDVISRCDIIARAMKNNGIVPVIKHIPGHGLANLDSHKYKDIAIISSFEQLYENDFQVFCKLDKDINWAMTAHLIYECLDKDCIITLSKPAIDKIKSFSSAILITDDIEMKAIAHYGNRNKVAKNAIDAGVDIILCCSENTVQDVLFLRSIPDINLALLNKISATNKLVEKLSMDNNFIKIDNSKSGVSRILDKFTWNEDINYVRCGILV